MTGKFILFLLCVIVLAAGWQIVLAFAPYIVLALVFIGFLAGMFMQR